MTQEWVIGGRRASQVGPAREPTASDTRAAMSDLWTEDPRLAAVYDTECAGREDHDFYLTLADELGAERVVDIGCGTGVFAVDLARRGHHVIGVDPAAPMLDIAKRRSVGLGIEWVHGTADDVPTAVTDLVVMMGHVAQYFVDDDDWANALRQSHRILDGGGRLVFETRNPAIRWDEFWTEAQSTATMPHPDGGEFTSWVEVQERSGSAESYTITHHGHTILPDGLHLTSAETLRFRSSDQITASVDASGFVLEETWGGWDRAPFTPSSLEMIVLARRT